jgi:hypothetical protein
LANRCIEKLVDDENSRIYTKMLDTLDAQESELFDLKEFIEDKKTKANENCAKNKGETEEGKGSRRGSEEVVTSDAEESSNS